MLLRALRGPIPRKMVNWKLDHGRKWGSRKDAQPHDLQSVAWSITLTVAKWWIVT